MEDINQIAAPPTVQLVGASDHADFHEAVALLRASARMVSDGRSPPELIVVAQARPGQVSDDEVQRWQRGAPLAGVVALLGSWCEGETRTGRPWPGIRRLYWYEFPAWWRRQLARRAMGRCPDWARPLDLGTPPWDRGFEQMSMRDRPRADHEFAGGVVIVCAAHHDTYDALADALQSGGYASVWQRAGRPAPVVHGVCAGIWEGGQLDDAEAISLAAFCRRLAAHAAPVVALLDFPRRDRVELARQCGAAAVLGKPWRNEDLVTTIAYCTGRQLPIQIQQAA